MRRIALSLIITLLFLGLLALAFTVQQAKAQTLGAITINPNGTISGLVNTNITNSGNVTYTFTRNNYLPIVVNRSNIIINGWSYTLQALGGTGFSLSSMSNVTIKNTTITHSECGIYLDSSSDNTLSGNNITENSDYGIYLNSSSDNNTLSGNNITYSDNGIFLKSYSDNNTLSGNNITSNGTNGIFLGSSSDNNTLSGNNITDSDYGITLIYSSDNNTLSGNNLTENIEHAIQLENSCDNNTLFGNNVTENAYGIFLYSYSDNNTIFGNNVTENSNYGAWISDSSGNTFYHNNFVDNAQQAYTDVPPNAWDNGYPSGGNYWSDYSGVDQKSGPFQNMTGSDGIGDTNYAIGASNIDRYPLMGPFHAFSVGTWNGTAYSVDTVSNSTLSNFNFNATAKTLTFNVTGTNSTLGFCRVTIPLSLMSGNWTVTVNGTTPSYLNITRYGNCTYIYFTYHHSTEPEPVQIISTKAVTVPEFQPFMLLPLLMIITLLGAIIFKKRPLQKLDADKSRNP